MRKPDFLFKSLFFILLCFTISCSDDDNDGDDEPEVIVDETKAIVPTGAALIVDKDFQSTGAWPASSAQLIGYTTGIDSCSTTNLISNTEEYSVTEIYFNGVNNDTVIIDYKDVAINTGCEDGSGITSDNKTITPGYVIFNKKSARNGQADPSVTLSAIDYVSTLQFSLSTTTVAGKGLSLYKSVNNGDYQLIGTYNPPTGGEYYSIAINESNVSFKFIPADSESGYIRMHDLKIYSDGVPDGSVLYVDEIFQKWGLKGYELPIPDPSVNKTGTLFIPTASLQSVQYDTTITYVQNVPVTFTLKDAAVNPYCYNHHGNVSLIYGLTTGYIELPINKAAYENKDISSSFTISAVPSVSMIEFWAAVTGFSGRYSLYKSVNGGEYTLYKDLIVPKYAGIGKYFRFYVNEKNVSFRFTPYTGEDAYTTTPKIYGVKIWSDGKP